MVVAQGNRLVFINPVIPGLTGYTKEELLAKPFLEFIHPDYRELMKNNYVKRIIGEPIDQRYPASPQQGSQRRQDLSLLDDYHARGLPES
ncbi:MAG: PAS domain-containing protein [Planctomycetota bacterium]